MWWCAGGGGCDGCGDCGGRGWLLLLWLWSINAFVVLLLLQPPKPIRLWGSGFRVEGLGFLGFALTSTRNSDLSEASKPRAFVKTQMRKPAWSLNRRILSSRVPKTCIQTARPLVGKPEPYMRPPEFGTSKRFCRTCLGLQWGV